AGLGQPSAPGRGGASSDALLSQSIALADNVVLPIVLEPADGAAATSRHGSQYRTPSGSIPGFAQYAKGVGHTLTSADPDGIARRVPLFVNVGDRPVPAYGLALAMVFRNVDAARTPADRQGRALVPATGSWLPRGFKVVAFGEVLSAIDQRQT